METGKTRRILSSASSHKPKYGGRDGTAHGILTRPLSPASADPDPGLNTVLGLVSLPTSLGCNMTKHHMLLTGRQPTALFSGRGAATSASYDVCTVVA